MYDVARLALRDIEGASLYYIVYTKLHCFFCVDSILV